MAELKIPLHEAVVVTDVFPTKNPIACLTCRHVLGDSKCKAFPEGIPEEVLSGANDHRKPIEGDHGIHYEAEPEED